MTPTSKKPVWSFSSYKSVLLTLSAQSGGEARVPDNNTETTERPEAEGTEAWRSSTGTQRTQTRYVPVITSDACC